jgi:hypothetical protein
MFSRIRAKLISFLANGEPVLLNWKCNCSLLSDEICVAYIPPKNHDLSDEELMDKAVLTPVNHKNRNKLQKTFEKTKED